MVSFLRHRPHLSFLATIVLLLGTACSRMGDQTPAVKKAIETHLANRSDLAINQMTMEMKEVKVDGDKAGADVVFRVTNAPEMQMAYHYELARQDGEWKVLQGRPTQAESTHPGGEADPDAADPNALPPGHPPLSEQPSGEMPESHPPATTN